MSSLTRERIARGLLGGCAVLLTVHAFAGDELSPGVMMVVAGLAPVALIAMTSGRIANLPSN